MLRGNSVRIYAGTILLACAPLGLAQTQPSSSAPAPNTSSADPRIREVLDAAAASIGGRERLDHVGAHVIAMRSTAGPEGLLYVVSDSRWVMQMVMSLPGTGSSPKMVEDIVRIPDPRGGEQQFRVKAWDPGSAPVELRVFLAEAGGHVVKFDRFSGVEIDSPLALMMRGTFLLNPVLRAPTPESITAAGGTATFAGPAMLGGKNVVAIDVAGQGYNSRLFFDPTTSRPAGSSLEYRDVEVPGGGKQDMKAEAQIEEWRDIDGIAYPSKIVNLSPSGPADNKADFEVLSIHTSDQAMVAAISSQLPDAIKSMLAKVRSSDPRQDTTNLKAWRQFFEALLSETPPTTGATPAPSQAP